MEGSKGEGKRGGVWVEAERLGVGHACLGAFPKCVLMKIEYLFEKPS